MRRRRARRAATSEYASCKEIHAFASLGVFNAYTDYQASLARCVRATNIARGYQQYRITKVEYIFKPLLDTFSSDNAGVGAGVPYLYAVVDKTAEFSAFTTADQLREAGAKPRRLDDKSIKITFKPAVLDYVYDKNNGTNTWAKPITSPWLATNKLNDTSTPSWSPSSIDHLGLAWMVEGGVNTVTQYQLEVVQHFQFRRPAFLPSSNSELPAAKQAPPLRTDVENHPEVAMKV